MKKIKKDAAVAANEFASANVSNSKSTVTKEECGREFNGRAYQCLPDNSKPMSKYFKNVIKTIPTKADRFGRKCINRGPILFGEVAVYAYEEIYKSSFDQHRAILEADERAVSLLFYLTMLNKLYREKFSSNFCENKYFGCFIFFSLDCEADIIFAKLDEGTIKVNDYELSTILFESKVKLFANMIDNLSRLSREQASEIEDVFKNLSNNQLTENEKWSLNGEIYSLLNKYLISDQTLCSK